MTAPTTMRIPGLRGEVIAPEHDGYDEARAVWNGTVDRRPRLIARCSGTTDVAAAVRFAREHGVSHLIVGRSERSRFYELINGSVIHRLIRAAGGIDVHVVNVTPLPEEGPPP